MAVNSNTKPVQFYLNGQFHEAYESLGSLSFESFYNILFSWWKVTPNDKSITNRLRNVNRRGIPFFFHKFLTGYSLRGQFLLDSRHHEFLRFYFQNDQNYSEEISGWLANEFPGQLMTAIRHNRIPFLNAVHWNGLKFLENHSNESLRAFFQVADKIRKEEQTYYETFLSSLKPLVEISNEEALCFLGHWMVINYADVLQNSDDVSYAAKAQWPLFIANHWYSEFLHVKRNYTSKKHDKFVTTAYFDSWYGKGNPPSCIDHLIDSIESAADWYHYCQMNLDRFCFDDFKQFFINDAGEVSKKTIDETLRNQWYRDGKKHQFLVRGYRQRENYDWLIPLTDKWDIEKLAVEIDRRAKEDIQWLKNWHIDHFISNESSADEIWELCFLSNQLKLMAQLEYGLLLDRFSEAGLDSEKMPYAIYNWKQKYSKPITPLMEIKDTSIYNRADDAQVKQALEIFKSYAPVFVTNSEKLANSIHNRFEPEIDFMRDTFFEIDGQYFFFPHIISNWVVPVQLIQRALYWKMRNENSESRKRETDAMEAFLEQKMKTVFSNVTIVKNLKYNYNDPKGEKTVGEIDLLVSGGNNVLLIEIKRTSLHPHPSERVWERNLSLNLAARQLDKTLRSYSQIRDQLNARLKEQALPPLPAKPKFHSLIVSTSLEWDHCFIEEHRKISWYELTQLLESLEIGKEKQLHNANVSHLLHLIDDDWFWKYLLREN